MGWLFPLKRIKQVDYNGCGIASVATVCGLTYERARAEFFPRRKRFVDDESLHIDSDQMLSMIHRLGFKGRIVESCPERLKNPTIFIFDWSPDLGSGTHAVVWDPFKRKILDPGPDASYNRSNKFYFNLWKRSRYASCVVTGKL